MIPASRALEGSSGAPDGSGRALDGASRAHDGASRAEGSSDAVEGPSNADDEGTVAPAPIHPQTVALVVLAVLASILMLRFAQSVFIPIVLSVLISHALAPIVSFMARLHIPRAVGAAVSLGVVAAMLGYGAYALSDEALQLVESLPSMAQSLRQSLKPRGEGEAGLIEKVQRAATELEKTATEAAGESAAPQGVTRVQVEAKPLDVRSYLRWGGSSIAAFATQLCLIFFFVYFILISGDLFKRKLVKIAGPSLAKRRVTVQILHEIGRQIERFLLIQLLACIVVAVLSAIVFRWAGLDHSLLWALGAGLLTSIPYFGALVMTVVISLVGFLQFGTISMAIYLGGLSFAIRGFETLLITPWLMGRAARMNGVAVFAGLLFWGWIWGVWGMLLAVPMLVILKSICDRVEGLKPFGGLLGD